jgi:hypothetical protein
MMSVTHIGELKMQEIEVNAKRDAASLAEQEALESVREAKREAKRRLAWIKKNELRSRFRVLQGP